MSSCSTRALFVIASVAGVAVPALATASPGLHPLPRHAVRGLAPARMRPVGADPLAFDKYPRLASSDAAAPDASTLFPYLAVPLARPHPKVILPGSRPCRPGMDGCATGPQAILDPTRPADGRSSIFFGIEALTREVSTVTMHSREFQVEPILVLGNPGMALAGRF